MAIEIYHNGNSNPIIISKWNDFFTYFGNPNKMSLTQFSKKYEFWNSTKNIALDSETVFGHLLELYRIQNQFETLLTKEL